MTTLKIEARQQRGSRAVSGLRKQGLVPGVMMSADKENQDFQVPHRELIKVLKSGVPLFDVELGGENTHVKVQEVQKDCLTDEVLHIDLKRVALTENIVMDLPITVKGTPAGLALGGVFTQLVHRTRVQGQAQNIPQEITVDVSAMQIGDKMRLKDVTLENDCTVTGQLETTVCMVKARRGATAAQVAEATAEGEAKPETEEKK